MLTSMGFRRLAENSNTTRALSARATSGGGVNTPARAAVMFTTIGISGFQFVACISSPRFLRPRKGSEHALLTRLLL